MRLIEEKGDCMYSFEKLTDKYQRRQIQKLKLKKGLQ